MPYADRDLEEAADELGRLDATAVLAPASFTAALQLAAVAELARLSGDRYHDPTLDALIAAEGDPLHDASLPAAALHWRDLLPSEERRVRSGATLSSQRFAIVAPALSTYSERPRLEAIWREPGRARPVLLRALDAAAWSPDRALGEAGAALMLCAGGRADRARLLPFADVAGTEREEAIAEWRAGRDEAWTRLGLGAAARRARAVRVAMDAALRALPDEDARLDPLGRAAITARRALAHLRTSLVTTMPLLAEELSVSRPAASDALERLTEAGIAREVTGRARDRVFAYASACAVAAAATAS
jgi:DNA-binding transcriptional ArsR family regulator